MFEPAQEHQMSKLHRTKSSFEEYQRRVVEKIKRHLERRRRQWENNIDNQVQNMKGEVSVDAIPLSPDQSSVNENISELPTICLQTVQSSPTPPVSPLSRGLICDLDDQPTIKVVSMETTDFVEESRIKYTVWVDIRSFLPNGSVTVRPEVNRITLISEANVNARTKCRKDFSETQEDRIDLKLEGIIELDTMRVHTTREGFMRIDIVTVR